MKKLILVLIGVAALAAVLAWVITRGGALRERWANVGPPATLDPSNDSTIRLFATVKRRQAEELYRQLHANMPPRVHEFFIAAEHGDWPAMANAYAKLPTRSNTDARATVDPEAFKEVLPTVLETFGACEQFTKWNRILLMEFANRVLEVLPSNSVYFGGTDPGRFVVTAIRDTRQKPDVYILTQNSLVDAAYRKYLIRTYGDHIELPSEEDTQRAFREYVQSVEARGEQLSADEQLMFQGGTVQMRGVEGVMNISGILARWIFDRNKDKHPFYIEESYAIGWMYPYLTPAGIIMTINRDPLPDPEQKPQLWNEIVSADAAYWDKLCAELDARPEFHRDTEAQKTFSKLRLAIGGLYANRHLTTEAEYAYKQALQLWPESPVANFRLAQFYMELGRADDALTTLQEFQKLDPLNSKITSAIHQINSLKQLRQSIPQLEAVHSNSPRDFDLVVQLAHAYSQTGQGDRVSPLLQSYLMHTDLREDDILQTAQLFINLGQDGGAANTLQLMTQRFPKDARGYYCLATIRAAQNNAPETLALLEKAIRLSPSLRAQAANNGRFAQLRNDPRFQQLVSGQ